jgi:hypothetical protein
VTELLGEQLPLALTEGVKAEKAEPGNAGLLTTDDRTGPSRIAQSRLDGD